MYYTEKLLHTFPPFVDSFLRTQLNVEFNYYILDILFGAQYESQNVHKDVAIYIESHLGNKLKYLKGTPVAKRKKDLYADFTLTPYKDVLYRVTMRGDFVMLPTHIMGYDYIISLESPLLLREYHY